MQISIRPRAVAVAAAAGLVLAAAAGGVGYAAASGGSNVSACVGSKGRLAVQSSKGKCPKKTSKVTIAKTGPRGATGATGKTGATGNTGAQGPGAAKISQLFLFGNTGATTTVAGVKYTPSCSVSSSDTTATLTIAGASGDSVFVRGLQADGVENGSTPTMSVLSASGTPSAAVSVLSNGGQSHLASFPSLLVSTGQTMQLITLRMYSNPVGGLFTTRCSVTAVVTPAG